MQDHMAKHKNRRVSELINTWFFQEPNDVGFLASIGAEMCCSCTSFYFDPHHLEH